MAVMPTSFVPSQRTTFGTNDQLRYFGALMTLLVVASFAVRLAAWARWGTGAIESEGAEYARIAENLRSGVGYVGLATPGAEVNFPPLFPWLIAGTSFITHNYELAGRIVSLVLGALLPLPVFGITSRLFNCRAGLIAAILVMLHPLLINLSFSVLSEGPYATLLLSAVYVAIRALNEHSIKLWALAGGAFGLSYLLRAEATGTFAIAALFALVAGKGAAIVRCKRALAAILVFLVIASPEIIFLYRSTGKVRLEAKSAIYFYTARRILAAEMTPEMSYNPPAEEQEVASSEPNVDSSQRWEEKWAMYGIDSHLNGTGTAMRPFAESVRGIQVTVKDLFPLGRGIGRNALTLLRQFNSVWLGAPFLPALALLGALRRPWRKPQASSRLLFLLIAIVPLLANPFALDPSEPRYSFIFVPLFCIWAANGLFEVALWTKASATAVGWRVLARPMVSQCIIPGLIILIVIISPIKAVRGFVDFAGSAFPNRVDKEVGVWIGHQQNGPVRIMDLPLPLTYHAGAQFSQFPYCTGDLALRYLDAAKVDYVVLRPGRTFTKFYEDWLTHGIPDPRAERLPLPPVPGADSFIIYRWHHNDPAGISHPARVSAN